VRILQTSSRIVVLTNHAQLFTTYMYANLGIHWASAVPGFIALAALPAPVLFWKYGAKVRLSCKYSREASEIMDRIMGANRAQEAASTDEKQEV
jgi:uncharacterized membrane protein YfcA